MLKKFQKQTATIMMMTKMTVRQTMMMKKIQISIRNVSHTRKVKMKIVMMMMIMLKTPRMMMIMMITTEILITPERRIPHQW